MQTFCDFSKLTLLDSFRMHIFWEHNYRVHKYAYANAEKMLS